MMPTDPYGPWYYTTELSTCGMFLCRPDGHCRCGAESMNYAREKPVRLFWGRGLGSIFFRLGPLFVSFRWDR